MQWSALHSATHLAWFIDEYKVDGFRFDVINFLYHAKEIRNNPPKDPKLVRPLGFNKDNPYGLQVHKFDNTQQETLSYLTRIRAFSMAQVCFKT